MSSWPPARQDSVLDAIARALQLDEAEHAHLYDLARAADTTPAPAAARASTSTAYSAEPGRTALSQPPSPQGATPCSNAPSVAT